MHGNTASDELSGIFRSVATKRKHGVLVVDAVPCRFEIYFQNGRITFVTRADQNPVREICRRLIAAGKLESEYAENAVSDLSGVERLCEHLVDERGLSREVFLRALRAYQTDVLHSLRSAEIGGTEFFARVVTIDPMFALSMSAGQLLLDLVEIEADDERFVSLFGEIEESDLLVEKRRAELASGALPAADELWGRFGTACALRDLAARALQSEHDVKSALLALYDMDAITLRRGAVDSPESEPGEEELRQRAEILARIEQEFDDEDGFDLFSDTPPAQGLDEIEGAERLVEFNDQLWARTAGRDAGQPVSTAPTDAPTPEVQVSSEEMAPTPQVVPLRAKAREVFTRMVEWNYLLREEKGLRLASAIVICGVLFLSALAVPDAIHAFLLAISQFSDRPVPWASPLL